MDECAEIAARHPALAPKYRDAIRHPSPAWFRLLEIEAKVAVVFEELAASRTTICGIGISVFPRDEFVQELSGELGISLFTLKKTWRSIYDRVAALSPELVPGGATREKGNSERGREKKQRLMAHLRAHPEELRPISRRLLEREHLLRELVFMSATPSEIRRCKQEQG